MDSEMKQRATAQPRPDAARGRAAAHKGVRPTMLRRPETNFAAMLKIRYNGEPAHRQRPCDMAKQAM